MCYKEKVEAKPMKWGRQNEPKARNKYKIEFKGNHKSFTCKKPGFVTSSLIPLPCSTSRWRGFLQVSWRWSVYMKQNVLGNTEIKL